MLGQVYGGCAVIALALTSMLGSNALCDRGWSSFLSRRIASVIGGFAFLVSTTWLNAWTAIGLTTSLTLLVLGLRLVWRHQLRGTRGQLPSQAWSEVTFAAAGTLCLTLGWGIFDQKWAAFLPIAFMAWGNNTAGILRDTVCRMNMGSIWPSLAMLTFGLAIAAFYHPFWIGGCAAIAATPVERYRPRFLRIWDYNLIIVLVALAVMIILPNIAA